jgi:hypothetical protein
MAGTLAVLVVAEVDEDVSVSEEVPVPVAELDGPEVDATEVAGEEVLVSVGLEQSTP